MKDYIKLQNGISWKNELFIKKILEDNKSLDITFDNGVLLQMSIDNNSPSIVQLLLNYFKLNQLNKHEADSQEYNNLRSQLTEILESLTDGVELSNKMREILSPYLNLSNQSNLSIITEISDENGSSVKDVKNDQPIKNSKFSYSLSAKIKRKLIDTCFDKEIFSPTKKHYKDYFKTDIQNLLKIHTSKEVMDFLDNLKDSFSLERTPSLSTLFRWKSEIPEKDYVNAKELDLQEVNPSNLTSENTLQNQNQLSSSSNKENDANFNLTSLPEVKDSIDPQDEIKIIGENISLDVDHAE